MPALGNAPALRVVGHKHPKSMKGLLTEQAGWLALLGTEGQRPQRGWQAGQKLLECHPRWRRGELSLSGYVCSPFSPVSLLQKFVSSLCPGIGVRSTYGGGAVIPDVSRWYQPCIMAALHASVSKMSCLITTISAIMAV